MMANELFYYSGAAFFILLTLLILVIGIKLIVALVTFKRAVRSWRRFIDETGTGIKAKLLELFLRFF
jgi:hypothetical protein